MADERKPETSREIIDKLYAMTHAEFNQFMAGHFHRLCSKPLPPAESDPQ